MFWLSIPLALILLFAAAYLYWRLRYGMPRKDCPPILLYHKVDPRFEWGGTRTLPQWFRAQLTALKEEGWETITLAEMVGLLSDDRTRPKSFLITFDDAYQSVYHHALPTMEELSYKCAIFVITDYIGKVNRWDLSLGGDGFRHLDADQIREFARLGHTVGAHTRTHRDLTRMSIPRVREEIESSKKALEDLLGEEVRFFSYPFGRYNQRVRQLVVEAGFDGAVASYPKRRNALQDAYALTRRGVYIIDNLCTFKGKVMVRSHLGFCALDLTSRTINFFTSLTVAFQSTRDFISRGKEGG